MSSQSQRHESNQSDRLLNGWSLAYCLDKLLQALILDHNCSFSLHLLNQLLGKHNITELWEAVDFQNKSDIQSSESLGLLGVSSVRALGAFQIQPDSFTVVTLNYYLNTATIIAYHSALVGKTVLLVFILKLKQFLIPSNQQLFS